MNAWAMVGNNDEQKKIPRKVKSQTTKKAVYRIRNWATYNQSLVQRGSNTMRISREVLATWLLQPGAVRTRGRQVLYSDQAISSLMLLKAVYHLLYRQTMGFGQSAMDVLRVKARVASALCEIFEAAEARRILRQLHFHYTPVHASWLNIVESAVLSS